MDTAGGIDHRATGGQLDLLVTKRGTDHQLPPCVTLRIIEENRHRYVGAKFAATHDRVIDMVTIMHARLIAGHDEIGHSVGQRKTAKTSVVPDTRHQDPVDPLLQLRYLFQFLILLHPLSRHAGSELAIDEIRPFKNLLDLGNLGLVQQFGDGYQHVDLDKKSVDARDDTQIPQPRCANPLTLVKPFANPGCKTGYFHWRSR